MKMITDKDLPNSISELTIADIQLLLEAVRAAGQLPRFMDDPEASFRLGYIIGMLYREITLLQSNENESPIKS